MGKREQVEKLATEILDHNKDKPRGEEPKYAPVRWLTNPMGYVDSYGDFWALTEDLQTVCGGKIKDVLAGKRPPRKARRITRELSINCENGHVARKMARDKGSAPKNGKGRPKKVIPGGASPILRGKLSLRKKAGKLGVSKDTVRKWQYENTLIILKVKQVHADR